MIRRLETPILISFKRAILALRILEIIHIIHLETARSGEGVGLGSSGGVETVHLETGGILEILLILRGDTVPTNEIKVFHNLV